VAGLILSVGMCATIVFVRILFGICGSLALRIGWAAAKEKEQDRQDRLRIFKSIRLSFDDKEVVDMLQHAE